MNADTFPSRRFRTLLDCLLVLILLLLIGAQGPRASGQGAAGVIKDQPAPMAAIEALPGALSQAANLPTADNKTMASVFAAEMSALTLPEYMLSLPLLTR